MTRLDRLREQERLSQRVAHIEEHVRVVELLHVLGVDYNESARNKICCIFPDHPEKTPSMKVYPETDSVYCFGCLDPQEPVWTPGGLVPIGELAPGDEVLTIEGAAAPVLSVERKHGNFVDLSLDLYRGDPLRLTEDHHCLVVRASEAIRAIPMLGSSSTRQATFSGKIRAYAVSRPVSLADVYARDIERGDYVLFPVIPREVRQSVPLLGPPYNERPKGPRPRLLDGLPVSDACARLYGLWLAEGSRYRGGVAWTFHIGETEFVAEVVATLREVFGLEAGVHERPNSNQVQVTCSSSHLEHLFLHFFGKHSHGKRLPPGALWWPVSAQRALIQGWLDGDGYGNTGTTTSEKLARGLFALGIQAGLVSSLARRPERSGRKRIWNVSFIKERAAGFFHELEGQNYLWLRVTGVVETGVHGEAVDIEVGRSPTFTTKLGVVHNCTKSGGVIEITRLCASRRGKAWSREKAVDWLEEQFHLEPPPLIRTLHERMASRLGKWRDRQEEKKAAPSHVSPELAETLVAEALREAVRPFRGPVRAALAGVEDYIWEEFERPGLNHGDWVIWAMGLVRGYLAPALARLSEAQQIELAPEHAPGADVPMQAALE
jgi:hypothetical protein